jgi:hypothetical protein
VRDARSGYLWTALRWAAAALHQTERVYTSLEPHLESHRRRIGKGVIRLTPEMQRPMAVFWSDVHFLTIAVKHLDARSAGRSTGTRRRPGAPAQLQYEPGNPVRLTIGADPLSINALEADIRRVEKELAEIEART